MENYSNSQRTRAVDIQELVNSFSQYLEKTRGLAPRTVQDYCASIEIFLHKQYRGSKVRLDKMSSRLVIRFFAKYALESSASRTQHITSALRSFFRYLKQAQLITEDLERVVPSVANRKKTSFSDVLSFEMTEKLLKTCDRSNPLGRRNYAILLLMVTLGLRSCEVCNLELSDIDWEKGQLVIRGKGAENRFPLFHEMGKALVDYLKYGRPNCQSKKVFIRSMYPFRGITTSCIRHIVSIALDHCGLNPQKRGAHLLRHSFAMQLLERGATLEEIGVVLRHKDIETTAIYAKANFSKLKAIVQPWPQYVKMEGSHD